MALKEQDQFFAEQIQSLLKQAAACADSARSMIAAGHLASKEPDREKLHVIMLREAIETIEGVIESTRPEETDEEFDARIAREARD